VVARSTPRVAGGALVGLHDAASAIAVGTPAWYAWLDGATVFAFTSPHGGFTARKERSGQRGWYWKAYRKRGGTLQRAYLGKAADLSLDRLTAIATELAQRRVGQSPAESRVAVSVARAVSDAEAPPMSGASLPTGTVTFLFTDIEGSTQLWEQQNEKMPAALARHDAILRQAIAAHGGVVFKTVGDGCHAVFARAADALAATLAAQRTLHAEAWDTTGPLRVRMALHTGAAEARDGDYYGSPLNRVARILAAGYGGQILLSRATHDLVADDLPAQASLRDLGEHALKDLSRPEQIFQLLSPDLPIDFPVLRTVDPRPAPTPAQPLPLLATKLYVPLPRANLVPRSRLVERLQAGLTGKLTLIAAPAGFGKTTLVSAWWATPTGSAVPMAWVSLDAGDNDPIRFWSYVIAALDTLQPGLGATALALLQAPQSPPIEAVLTLLLNAVSSAPPVMVLVLDDYQLIDAAPIHQMVAFLLDHLPPQLHLVISTRADPPLPLTRLRACQQLTELRAADLRFTPDEAVAFFTDVMGLPLSSDDIAALETRTEGWIAGLQFAALAMRDRTHLADFVRSFTGSHRFVMDYLAEEVLARQPIHIQTFLMETAILDRLCGSLCDAMLGIGGLEPRVGKPPAPGLRSSAPDAYSQIILEQLDRANLFLVPLDDERRWYRYHHLFAEVLYGRLTGGATHDAVATLHRRASAWFTGQGLIVEAVQHALAAQAWEQAAGLIEQHGPAIMHHGQVHTVVSWVDLLPEDIIRARPTLCMLHAALLMHTNQLAAAEVRLQDAERWIQPDTPRDQARLLQGQVVVTRANIIFYTGDLARCIAFARQALELLREGEFLYASAVLFAAHAYLVTGNVAPATEREVVAAVASARAADNLFAIVRSLTLLARLHALQGRLRAAAAIYAQAEQVASGTVGLPTLSGSAAFHFGLGDLLREWNDLAGAERHLAHGMDLLRGTLTVEAETVTHGYLTRASLHQAHGDSSSALATLEAFLDLARQRNFAVHLLARGTAAQAALWLAQGQHAAAIQWADTRGLPADDDMSFSHEREYLTLARVRIAQGHDQPVSPALHEAVQLLDRLLMAAEAGVRMHSIIQILILRMLAMQVQGDATGALSTLERVLTLAEPEGYMRIFVDEGAPMAELLRAAHARGIMPDYVAKLLAAFPNDRRLTTEDRQPTVQPSSSVRRPPSLVEPLTDREIDVLRLIAAGRSNTEIAQALIVAVSTIKTHVNRIFGKLGATSRTQAVARARELHLL